MTNGASLLSMKVRWVYDYANINKQHNKLDAMTLHWQLCHAGTDSVMTTGNKNGYTLQNKDKIFEDCTVVKARQMNVNKETSTEASRAG